MDDANVMLLKQAFKRYYFSNKPNVKGIEKREFGFATFDARMIRHVSFKDSDQLRAYLFKNTPADAYVSNAYYTNPSSQDMDSKGWLYADLIFDIDIKDLNLDCKKDHTINICSNCKSVADAKICNVCKSSMQEANIPCNNCISAGKDEVDKLLNLLNELGIDDVDIYFSGNNGFHVHAYDEDFIVLDANARAEILDYVSGNGLIPEVFGIRKDGVDRSAMLEALNIEQGWRGRIIRSLLANKDRASLIRSLARKGYDRFKDELRIIAKAYAASIDPVVTTDIHRIFRLERSISSKSGLVKVKVDNLDDFDPFNDSCLLDDEQVKVHVYYAPRFRLKDNNFGPYKDVDINLPLYAAVYLICKGLADAKA